MKLLIKNLRKVYAGKRSKQSLEEGQSLVEMMFGMVVVVFIMSGVIDLGRAYFTYVALEDAAGEAAMYLAVNPHCPGDAFVGGQWVANNGNVTDSCDPPENAVWRAQNAGGGAGLVNWSDGTKATFTITCYDNDVSPAAKVDCDSTAISIGDDVYVDIAYKFSLLSPVIPNINGSPTLTLTSRASQRIVVKP
jgi:hypothetical protein